MCKIFSKICKKATSLFTATMILATVYMPFLRTQNVRAEGISLSSTQFATPEQLKQLSLDGHIVFGYRAVSAEYYDVNSNEQTAEAGEM